MNVIKCKVDCYKKLYLLPYKSQIPDFSWEEFANMTMGKVDHEISLKIEDLQFATNHCNIRLISQINAFFINFKVIFTNQETQEEVVFKLGTRQQIHI